MILIIQQGGSSGEMYPHMFDTSRDANRYRASAGRSSFNTSEPVVVRPRLARKLLADPLLEADVQDLLAEAVGAAAELA